jgi:hypothetical protein
VSSGATGKQYAFSAISLHALRREWQVLQERAEALQTLTAAQGFAELLASATRLSVGEVEGFNGLLCGLPSRKTPIRDVQTGEHPRPGQCHVGLASTNHLHDLA